MSTSWVQQLKQILENENIKLSKFAQESNCTIQTFRESSRGRSKISRSAKNNIISALNKLAKEKYSFNDVFIEKIKLDKKKDDTESEKVRDAIAPQFKSGFILMPFGTLDDEPNKKAVNPSRILLKKSRQDDLFKLLYFALNDAFFQNYFNKTVGDWLPIKIERADTGAGRSPDLLDNVLLKISDSDFCLADLTVDNLNVALETGYAFACDKYIINIVQEDILIDHKEGRLNTTMSDLAGKIYHEINLSPIIGNAKWKKISSFLESTDFFINAVAFFSSTKDKLTPFEEKIRAGFYSTFFCAWLQQNSKKLFISNESIEKLNESYLRNIVRPLYGTIRPLWEKLISGGTEITYKSDVFASRVAADYASIFSNARKRIRILTTNLQGLVEHIGDMLNAIKGNPSLKIEILTLDPESEFVNSRGTLIGKEISEFRQEMKTSLQTFKTELKFESHKIHQNDSTVLIRIYREFPTQITYIIDDYVYSSVVSVNHQSRHNLVFKIQRSRKGVENSFYQHWDTIWARAIDIK
ncbi:MAG: hypothetical protein DWQ05_16155 [Calditrichaeota bacterium]|nr:MAG: hypothetical protein DWQ05_16155 [Calditrichota bacterium]